MKPGKIELGSASIYLSHSQIVPPTKRGFAREIREFFVPEVDRGKGFGTALLEEVCTQADEKRILLLIIADNERLQGFYERHGFQLIQDDGKKLMARPCKSGLNDPYNRR